MPASLSFPCPECGAKLSAQSSAVGSRVRCPKCDEMVRVRPPADSTAKDTRASRTRRDRDDDDRETDDRPRRERPRGRGSRKARGRGRRGPSPLLWVAVGVGAFVFLVGGGAAVYFLTGKGNGGSGGTGQGGTVPQGWKEVGGPADGFRAQMPGVPGRQEQRANVRGAVRPPVVWRSVTGDGNHDFEVVVVDFGQRSLPTDPAGLRRLLTETDSVALFAEKVLSEREARVAGLPGAELEVTSEDPDWPGNNYSVIRLVTSNGKLFVQSISAPRGKMDDKLRTTFFDSFRIP